MLACVVVKLGGITAETAVDRFQLKQVDLDFMKPF